MVPPKGQTEPEALTAHQTMRAATQAVVGTTELLEQILLFLPARDTVICMRVFKRWSECVHASPAMPKHLFLRPSGLLVQQFNRQRGIEGILHPPRRLAATFSASVDPTQGQIIGAQQETTMTPIRLCPLLHPPALGQPLSSHSTPETVKFHDNSAYLITSPRQNRPVEGNARH